MAAIDALNRLLAPIRRRVENMVARAVLQLVNDATKLQEVQLVVLAGETRGNIERFQQYGFTSVPLPGAEAVVLFVGGNRDHALAINVDDRRYRKKDLQPGESAIYTDEGDYVLLKRGRIVEVVAGASMLISCPDVTITGNLTVQGATGITVPNGDVDADGISLKTHVHGSVQSGIDTTGVPQ